MTRFDNDAEAQAWADAWVAGRLPTELVVQTISDERSHFERFNSDYGRLVAQFEVEYQALAQLVDRLNFVDRSEWPSHRHVQYVLLAYNVRTFYSALDRLVRGYYEDCIALTRGLYETFVRILFVSCYPTSPYNALMAKPPKGERRFNLTNFLRDDLGLAWETKYEIMSVFAHSNSLRVLEALERASERRGDPERFGVRFEYEPELIEAAAPFLQFTLASHMRFAVERLAGTGPALDADLVRDGEDALALLTYGLTSHPKAYWQVVAHDLDVIFKMLVVADRGDDWRAFLASARSRAGADEP